MSGKQTQRVLGHFVAEVLDALPLLSVFRAAYTFASDCFDTPVRLWTSVVREFAVARPLLAIAYADLGLRLHSDVISTDACVDGGEQPGPSQAAASFRHMVLGKNVGVFGSWSLRSGGHASVP